MMLSPLHSLRLAGIALVLARYRVLPTLGLPGWWCALVPPAARHEREGVRLALALQALGPAFIKLGQTLATRHDLLGETLANDLARLQDRLPPFSFTDVQATLEAELGAPLDVLFADFSDTPAAAASIAQVHRARLHDGQEVAVKILRPEIEQRLARDLALFDALARLAHRWLPASRRLRPREVVRTLEHAVRKELDLRLEAAAAAEMKENLAGHPMIRVPKILWQHTSRRVLTSEWIEATPFTQLDPATLPDDIRTTLARDFLRAFCEQLFRHGFFHADLHPGNLMLDQENRLALVDFGIMGRLDTASRLYLLRIADGFLRRDYESVARAHIAAGYVPQGEGHEDFILACRSIAEPILDLPLHELSIGRLLTQLFSITATFNMHTQPQLLLLQKSLILVESICRRLAPEMNLWTETQAILQETAQDYLGLRAQIGRTHERILTLLQQLPLIVESVGSWLEAERRAA